MAVHIMLLTARASVCRYTQFQCSVWYRTNGTVECNREGSAPVALTAFESPKPATAFETGAHVKRNTLTLCLSDKGQTQVNTFTKIKDCSTKCKYVACNSYLFVSQCKATASQTLAQFQHGINCLGYISAKQGALAAEKRKK